MPKPARNLYVVELHVPLYLTVLQPHVSHHRDPSSDEEPSPSSPLLGL